MSTHEKPLALRALGWMRWVAAFDLALGLFALGFAAFGGFTWDLFRGAAILIGVGVFGLRFLKTWQGKLESPA